MSDIFLSPKMIGNKPGIFYVYLHTRMDDGSIFYVGKGKGSRVKQSLGRNKYWRAIADKHGCVAEVILEFKSEACAFSIERAIIKYIGRQYLANLTDGGDGASGVKQSSETIAKRMAGKTGYGHHFFGKTFSAVHRRNLSTSHIGKRIGHESPTAKLDVFNFRNLDGRNFVGTRTEFKAYSSMGSCRVSDIITQKRRHSKGWYVSTAELSFDEVMKLGTFSPHCRLTEISIRHIDGRIETGIPLDLRKRLNLPQSHFDAVVRGDRMKTNGWSLLR